jgi:hypothetical protein
VYVLSYVSLLELNDREHILGVQLHVASAELAQLRAPAVPSVHTRSKRMGALPAVKAADAAVASMSGVSASAITSDGVTDTASTGSTLSSLAFKQAPTETVSVSPTSSDVESRQHSAKMSSLLDDDDSAHGALPVSPAVSEQREHTVARPPEHMLSMFALLPPSSTFAARSRGLCAVGHDLKPPQMHYLVEPHLCDLCLYVRRPHVSRWSR